MSVIHDVVAKAPKAGAQPTGREPLVHCKDRIRNAGY